jgi:hypothetical protein
MSVYCSQVMFVVFECGGVITLSGVSVIVFFVLGFILNCRIEVVLEVVLSPEISGSI